MKNNPFNPTKPVPRDRLRGRSHEVAEIDYYLSEALSGNFTNISILGRPQIGKTSLLNYCIHKATAQGMVAVGMDPWEYMGVPAKEFIQTVLRKIVVSMDSNKTLEFGLTTLSEPPTSDSEEEAKEFDQPPNLFLDFEDLLFSVAR